MPIHNYKQVADSYNLSIAYGRDYQSGDYEVSTKCYWSHASNFLRVLGLYLEKIMLLQLHEVEFQYIAVAIIHDVLEYVSVVAISLAGGG
jgi:hypothetical protein